MLTEMDAIFMPLSPKLQIVFTFMLLASCAAQAQKPLKNPLETYLSRADGYASLTISFTRLGKDISGSRDPSIDIDHADYIEELRPAYETARAYAPESAGFLTEHWVKFNQCMTLGLTTEELAQACKYELGGIRAKIAAK